MRWPRITYRKLRSAVETNETLESLSVAVIKLAPPDLPQTVMAIVCDELCWARQMIDECVPPQPRPQPPQCAPDSASSHRALLPS